CLSRHNSADGSPRIHPVVVHFSDTELFVYMAPASPKVGDLQRDPRYTLHCGVEDTNGGNGEVSISGYAQMLADPVKRASLFENPRANGFDPLDSYVFFVLSVEGVVSIVYETGQAQRTKWRVSAKLFRRRFVVYV